MDFSGEVAEWQRNVSEGKAGNSRRYAVMEGLEVRSGKSYLDVGCGGGHLVRELGNATGMRGALLVSIVAPKCWKMRGRSAKGLPA